MPEVKGFECWNIKLNQRSNFSYYSIAHTHTHTHTPRLCRNLCRYKWSLPRQKLYINRDDGSCCLPSMYVAHLYGMEVLKGITPYQPIFFRHFLNVIMFGECWKVFRFTYNAHIRCLNYNLNVFKTIFNCRTSNDDDINRDYLQ